MISDLYFIPILRDALAKQDREPALVRAFQAIERQGRIPRCKRGYAQFLRFMGVVAEHAALVASASVATEPVEKESEDVPDVTTVTAPREILGAEPSDEMAEDGIAPPLMGVIVEKDGKLVKDAVFHTFPAIFRVTGVLPGLYRLRLSTGRLLWEGRLSEEDLLWRRAFPGEYLQLAASTGDGERRVSRRIEMLGGEVVLSLLPGVETGTIEICVARRKDIRHDA